MKKTAIALAFFAAAVFAPSCQKETIPVQEDFVPMTISAVAEGLGTPVKSAIEFKYDVTWTTADKIFVTGGEKNDTFTITSESVGKTLGKFTQDGTTVFVSQETPSCDVEAYYPSSMVSGTTLTWPANQTYSLENAQTVPMYSKKTITGTGEQSFSFASLGAMLQIVFNTAQPNVILKSIEVKDGSKTMSGAFHVDENGMAIIDADDKAGITLDLGEGKSLGKGANYFNIAVPAGEYSNLSITFTANDNSTCTFTGGNVTLNHNTVGRLTLTGFTPAAGCATANGLGYVKWVQLWKNGPKFAEFNVGAKSDVEYGGYYAWGGSTDKVDDHNTGTSVLSGDYDTATKLWGSNWRMPTQAELGDLLANCNVAWTDNYKGTGKKGRIFTGKTEPYSSNSVFLPTAGRYENSKVTDSGNHAHYWSSTPYGNDNAYFVYFHSGGQGVFGDNSRSIGFSVRAVLNEN